MKTVFAYLRMLLFITGLLAGIQLPGFVDQYGKSLEAHFNESANNLEEFRDDARRFFNGDLPALIRHYKMNGDPVFTAGGESIEAVYNRYLLLEKSLASFNSSPFQAYRQSFLNPIGEIQQEVRRNYSYMVKLDTDAMVFGLVSGLLVAVMGELFLYGLFRFSLFVFCRLRPGTDKQYK